MQKTDSASERQTTMPALDYLELARQFIALREAYLERSCRTLQHLLHADVLSVLRQLGDSVNQLGESVPTEVRSQIEARLQEATDAVRTCMERLYPYQLTQGTLAEVLLSFLRSRSLTAPEVEVDCRIDVDEHTYLLDNEIKVALFRILQEAIQNALEHSGARRIMVCAAVEGGSVKFTIADDGNGGGVCAAAAGGMAMMVQKSVAIGASIVWQRPREFETGTEFVLHYKLPAKALNGELPRSGPQLYEHAGAPDDGAISSAPARYDGASVALQQGARGVQAQLEAQKSAPPTGDFTREGASKTTILVADDQDAFITKVSGALRSGLGEDFSLLHIYSAEEAVRLSVMCKPDLILADIHFRKDAMDGIAAAEAIWKQWPAAKIIIYSQFGDRVFYHDKLRRIAPKGSAYGFVIKENDTTALVDCVRAVLSGRTYMDSAIIAIQNSMRVRLSEDEYQTILCMAAGHSRQTIARILGKSEGSVDAYLASVYQKLGIARGGSCIVRAIQICRESGIIVDQEVERARKLHEDVSALDAGVREYLVSAACEVRETWRGPYGDEAQTMCSISALDEGVDALKQRLSKTQTTIRCDIKGKVRRDGSIYDVEVEESAGLATADRMALDAVLSHGEARIQALPAGVPEPLLVRFTFKYKMTADGGFVGDAVVAEQRSPGRRRR